MLLLLRCCYAVVQHSNRKVVMLNTFPRTVRPNALVDCVGNCVQLPSASLCSLVLSCESRKLIRYASRLAIILTRLNICWQSVGQNYRSLNEARRPATVPPTDPVESVDDSSFTRRGRVSLCISWLLTPSGRASPSIQERKRCGSHKVFGDARFNRTRRLPAIRHR